MGDRGTCHIYDGCDIYDAFFRVAQEPEDAEAGRVSQLLHGVSHRTDGIVIGHDVRKFLTGQGIVMDMWQFDLFLHGVAPSKMEFCLNINLILYVFQSKDNIQK